jgi:dsDNA-specific endonuclease/ATPase MutS2
VRSPSAASESGDDPVPLPITGELDLHTFRPADVGELIPAYLDECAARGIRHVRIIHGKGTGTLRTTVHALLARNAKVASFRLGDETSGSWGATIVTLRDTP